MEKIEIHAAVRLYPTENPDEKWIVVNLKSCITYRCSRLATLLIIAFFEGGYYEVICDLFASRYFFAKTEV